MNEAPEIRPLQPKGSLGANVAPPPSDETTFNVALYPFVPSPDAFQQTVAAAWNALGTGVTLNFVYYDPYRGAPPPTLDVFAFDCIYASDLSGFSRVDSIEQDEITDFDDLLPFVPGAADVGPGQYAGIPYLACISTLYYREDDPSLGEPSLGLAKMASALGRAPVEGPIPEKNAGLLIDLSSGTTDGCVYIQSWEETYGVYPSAPPLPDPAHLDQTVMGDLHAMVVMAGKLQAGYVDPGDDRLTWFADGLGRALVGFTETMAHAPESLMDILAFRPFPFAADASDRTPCYADAIGLRPGLADKRPLALQLANIIASHDVLLTALTPGPTGALQYLLPARTSVLAALAEQFAVYGRIEDMLTGANAVACRLGPTGRAWLATVGPVIRSIILKTPVAFDEPPLPPGYASTPAGLWRRGP